MINAEYRPFAIAIVLSLAVHFFVGISGVIRPTPKITDAQKPTIVMRQFSLEQTPSAPTPKPTTAKVEQPRTPKQAPKVIEKNTPPQTVIEEKKPEIIEEKIEEKIEEVIEEQITEQPIFTEIKDEEEITPVVEENQSDPLRDLLEENQLVEQVTNNNDNGFIQPKNNLPKFPNSAKLKYEGPMGVTGTMNYERHGQNYTIHAAFNIPFNKREFEVSGTIDGNNLIAHKYTDKRKGKVYASAIFSYENKVIVFGQGEQPQQVTDDIDFVKTPAYDLFSWAWQVAINGGNMPETVWVTNGKKIYQYNTLYSKNGMKESVFDTGEGKLRILSLPFEREGSSTEYEFSFAPDFANVPAVITMTADGKKYTIHLIAAELDGKKEWQAVRQTGVRNKD